MSRLEIEGVDDDLKRRLEERAQREGVSVADLMLTLIRACPIGPSEPRLSSPTASPFMGDWSQEEADELMAAFEPSAADSESSRG